MHEVGYFGIIRANSSYKTLNNFETIPATEGATPSTIFTQLLTKMGMGKDGQGNKNGLNFLREKLISQ